MGNIKSDHEALDQLGLLDQGQPTFSAHQNHVSRMERDFTPTERRMIRNTLDSFNYEGMGDYERDFYDDMSESDFFGDIGDK